MAGQSRKWMILVATIWISAFTGTNFDFSAYSSTLKSVLGISQVQLNYLAVASDLGKVFGWSSGLALLYLPLWVVLFMAAFMGFFGYGIQWLVIRNIISLPYILVAFLCLLSGCSICWFNTVCFVLCIDNFPSNRSLALALTISFNGVSAALYALAGNAINSSSSELYLLLNAIVPLVTSFAALVPVLQRSRVSRLPSEGVRSDSLVFLLFNFIAIVTGIYLLIFAQASTHDVTTARLLLGGAVFLLFSPLCVPGIIFARAWFHRSIHGSLRVETSTFNLVDIDDLELHKELIHRNSDFHENRQLISYESGKQKEDNENKFCCETMLANDRLSMLGQEHPACLLIRRLDFWLYYLAYICGGTIGLVYSNNLGQIAQSLGQGSRTTNLLILYSAFSFFGRLLSATPDYIRIKMYFARTAWLTIALVPTPIAFFLLALEGNEVAVDIGTALVGLSSGFIIAAAVSITSELFGPNSAGVNHNILITNIPIGSLVYGVLAALVYDAHAKPVITISSDVVVCMGRQCYFITFLWWGCLSVLGLACSLLLFIRTKHAYDLFERNRISTQLY